MILVVAEQRGGVLNRATWEALTAAQALGRLASSGATLRVVLVGAAGTVLVSRDQGQSFQKADSGGTRPLAGATLGAPNAILLMGEGGVRPLALPSGPKR